MKRLCRYPRMPFGWLNYTGQEAVHAHYVSQPHP